MKRVVILLLYTSVLVTGAVAQCTCSDATSPAGCPQLLTALDGTVTYVHANDTNNVARDLANFTAIETTLRNVFGSKLCNVTIFTTTLRGRWGFDLTYIRDQLWTNYTDFLPLKRAMTTEFNKTAIIESIFTNPANIQLTEATLHVDECESSWHGCSEHAKCWNVNPGVLCRCKEGYEGSGTECSEITCSLSAAPPVPSKAEQTVVKRNGTIWNSPPDRLPYGTTINMSCSTYYELRETMTGERSITVVRCGSEPKYKNTNWSGNDVACAESSGFRVAIIIAMVSAAIIFIVGSALMVSCSKRQ